jgi:uncharacterized protein
MYSASQNPLIIIKTIITQYLSDDVSVFLFGSRAKGNARTNSDYDICVQANDKIPLTTLAMIKSALYEIPRKVDLIDYHRTDNTFLSYISPSMQQI